MIKYDVALHYKEFGWCIYEDDADSSSVAISNARKRVCEERNSKNAQLIDMIRLFNHNTGVLLREFGVYTIFDARKKEIYTYFL